MVFFAAKCRCNIFNNVSISSCSKNMFLIFKVSILFQYFLIKVKRKTFTKLFVGFSFVLVQLKMENRKIFGLLLPIHTTAFTHTHLCTNFIYFLFNIVQLLCKNCQFKLTLYFEYPHCKDT